MEYVDSTDELAYITSLEEQNAELIGALLVLASTARTFRNVLISQQEWTSIDDEVLDAAFQALNKVTGYA